MVDRILEKKVVGIKQATKIIKKEMGKVLYVASDAEETMLMSIITLARKSNVEIRFIDTMKELGILCGIDVGAAVAVTIKD